MQSAYRAFHSTETAEGYGWYILLALDRGDIAFLILLGLFSAFETVDHATLLEIDWQFAKRNCGFHASREH